MKKIATSFDRRREAALRKVHLPTVEDLIYGMPFYGGELEGDVREFASRSVTVAGSLGLYPLQIALNELAISPSMEGVENLGIAVDGAPPSTRVQKFVDIILLRRRIYLAAWGKSAPLSFLAMETINAAFDQLYAPPNHEAYLTLMFRAMELLATAAAAEPFQTYLPGNRLWHRDNPDTNLIHARGIKQTITRLILDEENKDRIETSRADLPGPPEVTEVPTAVVIPSIGNLKTAEGKTAASYAADVVGVALPLTISVDPQQVRSTLLTEFPHAGRQIDVLLKSLLEGSPIQLAPTIIVGAPGGGKSHFCKRLMEVLGISYTMVPFAGISDSAVIGTARRYSTGEPSLPVSTIITHRVANPGLILDEVEKVGTGRQNGNALDSMLPMLEGVTASSYHDPYFQAPVDISHINWLMTANSLGPLSRPFRDRCRIIEFPVPTTEYLGTYVANMLPALAGERGQSAAMFHLDGAHLASLHNWKDGSLRTLKKMLEALLDEHESHGRRLAN